MAIFNCYVSSPEGRLLLVKPAKWPKKNSRLPSFPASSASRIACFWMSSPQLTRCREARAWTERLWQHNVIIIESPIGSMYAIYGNIYHQYTPNVSIYTIHGSYGSLRRKKQVCRNQIYSHHGLLPIPSNSVKGPIFAACSRAAFSQESMAKTGRWQLARFGHKHIQRPS